MDGATIVLPLSSVGAPPLRTTLKESLAVSPPNFAMEPAPSAIIARVEAPDLVNDTGVSWMSWPLELARVNCSLELPENVTAPTASEVSELRAP